MATELWPDSWCVPEMLWKVIDFIRAAPINVDDKKQALLSWCDCAGVQITAELVYRATGLVAGEV